MKASVVISICDNRLKMFKRSLDTWVAQTEPKSEFELIIVDDNNREEEFDLCRQYHKNYGLQFQLVRIDNSKCDKPVKTFIPVLSNNVGFRRARGDVVVVTGPETLQLETNISKTALLKDRRICAYGLVWRSSPQFVNIINEKWDVLKNETFQDYLNIPGAMADCRTRPPHPPAYWYYMATAKNHIETIGGVDEEFAAGFCAEDDDFANRMRMSGVIPSFDHSIVGIHQDHSMEDSQDNAHSIRNTPEGIVLRKRNVNLMRQNVNNRKVVANVDHRWGDEKVITFSEVLGG